MEGRKGVFVELSGRGDRELTVREGSIELRGILRSTSARGDYGQFGSIFYWYDEAVALRDALNRYLGEFEPPPPLDPADLIIGGSEKRR